MALHLLYTSQLLEFPLQQIGVKSWHIIFLTDVNTDWKTQNQYPNSYYQVTCRANESENIFLEDQDKKEFLKNFLFTYTPVIFPFRYLFVCPTIFTYW